MKKIIIIVVGVIILAVVTAALAGMYKFNYLASQEGYDVDGNKLEVIEETDLSNDAGETLENLESQVQVTVSGDIDFTGPYTLDDDVYGTQVVVTIDGENRTMISNALPNHVVGEFPNPGNPNTISEQSITNTFPLVPTYTGDAIFAREPGVAINGIKFEPQTAERLTCETGEVYSIEALEGYMDFGVDENNAHVQPTGEYHYHGASENLAEFAGSAEPVLVGFAHDGYYIYYSPIGAYSTSYRTKSETRSGTGCAYERPGFSINEDLEGTTPDGSFVSDWEYVEGLGDLDECNGIEINGQYGYVVTDTYPYIPRCLMGQTESQGAGAPGGGQGGPGERPPRTDQ